MLVYKEYADKKITHTPFRKFPLQVSIEETKWKFKVVFADNFEESYETDWLWKGKFMDRNNRERVDRLLDSTENTIQFKLSQSIQNGLMGLNRERQIEAKINRLFNDY